MNIDGVSMDKKIEVVHHSRPHRNGTRFNNDEDDIFHDLKR